MTGAAGGFARGMVAASIVVLSVVGAARADGPIVRARIEPTDVVVGEEQRLVVDVLVPTWLLGAPGLPELEIPGVIVIASGEAGVNLSETMDGATWSGVSNEYALYAQRPGRFVTPRSPVHIRFSRDGTSADVEIPLPETRFAARMPPGVAAGTSMLAASSVDLSQTVEPAPKDLRVGAALRRTVVLRAEKTRSMLLPELETARVSGLTPYPDTPKLVDRPGRRGGPPLAERTESTSWILERPGTYELPAIEVPWWNVGEGRMETAEVPAIEFTVVANPALAAGGEARSWDVRLGWLAVVGAIVLMLLVAARRSDLAPIRRRLLGGLDRARHSERARFGAFVRATREGGAAKILAALFSWLDRRSPASRTATIAEFVEESSSPELGSQVEGLEATLFSREEGPAWTPSELRRAAVEARRRAHRAKQESASNPLEPLNP